MCLCKEVWPCPSSVYKDTHRHTHSECTLISLVELVTKSNKSIFCSVHPSLVRVFVQVCNSNKSLTIATIRKLSRIYYHRSVSSHDQYYYFIILPLTALSKSFSKFEDRYQDNPTFALLDCK